MQTTYTGIDWFDFTALRPAEEHSGPVTVCNMREHEHGIAEYVLLNMLEVSDGLKTPLRLCFFSVRASSGFCTLTSRLPFSGG